MGRLADDLGRFVDVKERQIGAAAHIEQDTPRAVDGHVQQRAGDGRLRRLFSLVVPLAMTDGHQRCTAFGHDGPHIGKVEVDQTGHGDQLGNALDALAQYIIGHAERLLDAGPSVDDLQQAVVGDGDEGIHLLLEGRDAFFGHRTTLGALEGKRLGDHADGQGARLAGDAGDNRGRAGARATPHAGSDKHHVSAVDDLVQVIAGLFGGLFADSRVSAGAQPASQLVADAHPTGCCRHHQRLSVGVDGNKLNTAQALLDHAVDGVATAAAHAQNFDAGKVLHVWNHILLHVALPFGARSSIR